MQKVLTIMISLLTTIYSYGQGQQNGERIMAKIAELYNKEAYRDMYQMHSSTFKSNISQDQLTGFYKNNLMVPLGKIVSWKSMETKDSIINYFVQFKNGALDLSFSFNDQNEITGIKWLPHKENTNMIKRDVSNIAYDNLKHTRIELLIDSLCLDHLQDSINCGLSIGIINGDKSEMFFYGSNYKDVDVLPGMRTLYEIGSISKTFTAILLAHAVNEGKISLDDDIRKYLPGKYPRLQYKNMPVTVKDLSNHTSGLPPVPDNLGKQPQYNVLDPYKNYSKEMMYSYLKKVKIDTFPGTVNQYSNYGVALLGVILENVYQRPLEDLIKKYVLEPAKMNYTKFILDEAERARMATGYDGQTGAETPPWNMGAFIAAGGIRSNMEDMLNYLSANMDEINPDFKLSHQQTYKDMNIAIGLNWILTTTANGNTLIWHNGETGGFSSFCGYIKEKKIGVVVLNNSGVKVDNIALNILKEMSREK